MTASAQEHIYIGKILYVFVIIVKRFPYKHTTYELGTESKPVRAYGVVVFAGHGVRTDTAAWSYGNTLSGINNKPAILF